MAATARSTKSFVDLAVAPVLTANYFNFVYK